MRLPGRPGNGGGRVPSYRPALVAAVLTCAALMTLTACRSGDDHASGAGPTTAGPSHSASSGAAPATSPASACPSRTEIAHAVEAADHSTGVVVSANVVCRGDWATAPMRYPGSDPARVVVRRQQGRVRLVTYGTDGLCQDRKMKQAPAEIKKALGVYC
jgi:hypothetical protein